jgi:hypothetical protein
MENYDRELIGKVGHRLKINGTFFTDKQSIVLLI